MMIKLLPIDYCGTIEELSKWHDEWSCEVFGSIDPSRYYKQAGEGGRYLYGVAEDMSLNEEKATRERVLELLLRIRSINQKLSGMSISQHLQYEEREQMKMERKTLYDEYLELVQPEQDFNSEPEQVELKGLLPDQLKTDEAVTIFQRAIDAQLIERTATGLKWVQIGHTGGKGQLAYFCGKLFGYEYDVYGNKGGRVNYEGLEKLFGVTRLDRALKQVHEAKKHQWWRETIDAIF